MSQLETIMNNGDFINQALIVTCLSILLEVFGHVFISVAATFGYFIYFVEPKFIIFADIVKRFRSASQII